MNRFPYRVTILLGIALMGAYAVMTILNLYAPIFLAEFGVSASLIGLILSIDSYLGIFLLPLVGALSDRTRTRIGRRRPWVLAGAPLAALAFMAIPRAQHIGVIIVVIVTTNLALGMFLSPLRALLPDLVQPQRRSAVSGVLNVLTGVGGIIAFIAGGALFAYGRSVPFVSGAVFMLAALLPIVVFVREAPPSADDASSPAASVSGRAALRHMLRSRGSRHLVLGLLLIFMGLTATEKWLSLYGTGALKIDPGHMGMIIGISGMFFLASAIPIGIFSSRVGYKRVIAIAALVQAGLYVCTTLVRDEVLLVVVLSLGAIGAAAMFVNAFPLLLEQEGDSQSGLVSAMYTLMLGIAAALGSQIVGVLIDISGSYAAVFIFPACTMLLATLCLRYQPQAQPQRGPIAPPAVDPPAALVD